VFTGKFAPQTLTHKLNAKSTRRLYAGVLQPLHARGMSGTHTRQHQDVHHHSRIGICVMSQPHTPRGLRVPVTNDLAASAALVCRVSCSYFYMLLVHYSHIPSHGLLFVGIAPIMFTILQLGFMPAIFSIFLRDCLHSCTSPRRVFDQSCVGKRTPAHHAL
jgi:hypothetical protein